MTRSVLLGVVMATERMRELRRRRHRREQAKKLVAKASKPSTSRR